MNAPWPLNTNGMRASHWEEGGQVICSGHKTFDRQSSGILPGQQIGNTVQSWCVRPCSETECNGHTFSHGHLRDFDMKGFGRLIGYGTKQWIRNRPEFKGIVYVLFTYTPRRGFRDPEPVLHGSVITTMDYAFVTTTLEGRGGKSAGVVNTAASHVCRWESLPVHLKEMFIRQERERKKQ